MEKELHLIFEPDNLNKEFFTTEPGRVIRVLKLMDGSVMEDVTPSLKEEGINEMDPVDRRADNKVRSMRPRMDLEEMGIPVGSTLRLVDSDIECVTTERRGMVRYEGEEYSLTALTKKLRNLDYSPRPIGYWLYEGKSLEEIYNETYPPVHDA